MRLMIVDDEYFAIQGILDGVNWDVLQFREILQAGTYAQAVEQLQKQPVDIVLCDIEMPDESGLELIAWINRHCPDTECLILSCNDEFDFARRAVQLNCLDYILKPVRFDYLTEVLASAVQTVAEKRQQAVLEDYGKFYVEHRFAPEKGDNGCGGHGGGVRQSSPVGRSERLATCQYGVCQPGSSHPLIQEAVWTDGHGLYSPEAHDDGGGAAARQEDDDHNGVGLRGIWQLLVFYGAV